MQISTRTGGKIRLTKIVLRILKNNENDGKTIN